MPHNTPPDENGFLAFVACAVIAFVFFLFKRITED